MLHRGKLCFCGLFHLHSVLRWIVFYSWLGKLLGLSCGKIQRILRICELYELPCRDELVLDGVRVLRGRLPRLLR